MTPPLAARLLGGALRSCAARRPRTTPPMWSSVARTLTQAHSAPPQTCDKAARVVIQPSSLMKKTLPVRRAAPITRSAAAAEDPHSVVATTKPAPATVGAHRVIAYAPLAEAETISFSAITALINAPRGDTPRIRHSVQPSVCDDVLHIASSDETGDLGELFVFKDGSLVAWGPRSSDLGSEFIATAMPGLFRTSLNSAEPFVTDEMEYVDDPVGNTTLMGDRIVLGNSTPSVYAKLAFSQALSRSAKVAAIEAGLDDFLESIRNIPLKMASGTSLGLSRSRMFAKTGELLRLRASIYLSGSVESLMDTPDYYWSRPVLGEYFELASHWLDIEPRISVLNRKLDYASYCVEVIRNDYSERHSQKLEFMIIALIMVEVLFELLYFYERRMAPKPIVNDNVAATNKTAA